MQIFITDIHDINDLLSNLDSIFGHLDSTLLNILSILGIIGIILTAVFSILTYLLTGLGLFNMARKTHHPCPWLAWIPFVNNYVEFTIPKKPYTPLIFKKEFKNRTHGFILWLCALHLFYLVPTILGMLTPIPIIGPIFGTLATIITTFYAVIHLILKICILYPMFRDLYGVFLNAEKAKAYSIVSVICSFVFPFGVSILELIASRKPVLKNC